MTTDDKNQQQNKISNEKNINKNVTSDNIPGTNNETNNINSDIIVELQQTKKKLKLANLLHKDFITNTALSIKTPCTSIFALALTLLEIENNNVKKLSIADIADCTKELIDYSTNMLDFVECYSSLMSTTNVVSVPIISKKFNHEKLVSRVINRLKLTSKYKGIRLAKSFVDIPDTIGDSYRIEAILTQLVSNAINFTEKGHVFLNSDFFPACTVLLQNNKESSGVESAEAQKAKDVLQFVVHDTGIGMSEEKQQYIYEQLNSLDSSSFTSSTSKDTGEKLESNSSSESNLKLGLGLSLVKQFIADLNGKIEISSQQGKSTTFTLQVPVKLPLTKERRYD
ncbi:HAMP domain-containing sensor histidine kinase [Candidatus Tisiphia endosymbiont of Metellina segmentata]|uniref:sensor histidine kinase n=1 Tax=Candidatus Tisiphia endosymbiont of Metellina segmentata TaxID=3066274 RepID=UPI00313E1FC9